MGSQLYYMLALQFETVFDEFPVALIQLHTPECVLSEPDMNPVKDFEQDCINPFKRRGRYRIIPTMSGEATTDRNYEFSMRHSW